MNPDNLASKAEYGKTLFALLSTT